MVWVKFLGRRRCFGDVIGTAVGDLLLFTVHKIDNGCADYTIKSKVLSGQVEAARARHYCREGVYKVGSLMNGWLFCMLWCCLQRRWWLCHGGFMRLRGEKVKQYIRLSSTCHFSTLF
jgi:hypothetical protein